MRKTFPVLFFITLLIILFSCSTEAKRSRKPVCTISITPNQKNYIYGESISIKINTKLKNGEIENIKLFYNDVLLSTKKELDFVYTIDNIDKLGNNSISVVATKTDGIYNKKIKNITVFSNITPSNYTYKISKEYPHSLNYFTEGFLIYDNYLYEGTGDHGTSAIYKTELSSGKVLQTKNLDSKYFGEGVTILNNKIYQLTYKSKMGVCL